ncbi:MAG: (2Fe-2S) ferredoxin domain-containing protein [Clostridiales bacterium]|jgi:NADP-reducing hydrogenase subunit HndB|nr:(2Fe-2S) ferredoxin domain-containing protein [Clostridiales bacterium]
MKTLAELEEIRQRTLERIQLRREDKDNEVRVVVGMATCGIAAGARPVMLAFMEEAGRRKLSNVTVSQTGCIGMCRLEPMADVCLPGQEKVTYVHLDPDKVRRIVAEHIVNGRPVAEYTVGYEADSQ